MSPRVFSQYSFHMGGVSPRHPAHLYLEDSPRAESGNGVVVQQSMCFCKYFLSVRYQVVSAYAYEGCFYNA
jgi:hypothetical protein